jgi:hypothetical protein
MTLGKGVATRVLLAATSAWVWGGAGWGAAGCGASKDSSGDSQSWTGVSGGIPRDVLPGLGLACHENSDCPSGLVCRDYHLCDEYDDYEGGGCYPPSTVHDCCDEDSDCVAGLVCDYDALACSTYCLVPERGEREPSGCPGDQSWDDCAQKDEWSDSVPYLMCYPHVDGGGTCLQYGLAGYRCWDEGGYIDFPCAPGLVCKNDYCVAGE